LNVAEAVDTSNDKTASMLEWYNETTDASYFAFTPEPDDVWVSSIDPFVVSDCVDGVPDLFARLRVALYAGALGC
jgi:hypothetical protein